MTFDLHADTLEFQNLCDNYREAIGDNKTALAKMEYAKIQSLVFKTVDRLRLTFKLDMTEKKTRIDIKRGIMMPGMTIPRLIGAPNRSRVKPITLNIQSQKKSDGINMLLDYSGSMWFDEQRDTIDGVKRIMAQNFLTLCTAGLISRLSPKSVIQVTAYCQTPIIILKVDSKNPFERADWDGLIVHNEWGSGIYQGLRLLPTALKGCKSDWFNSEYLNDAIETSVKSFTSKNQKFKKFINLLITDGGLSRQGESELDRAKFMKTQFNKITQMSDNNVSAFIFIKQQATDTEEFCKTFNIDYTVINERDQMENAFVKLTNLVNHSVSKSR